MREIKFRYRIKSLKTKKVTAFHKTLEAIETGDMFDFCFDKDEKEIRVILSRDECTGHFDKTEKDIYECDIILKFIKGNTEIKFNPFKVEWHPITCGWNITGKRGHYYEIIGNIYENPELLK